MNYLIREMREDEYNLLNNFIYEAVFVPEGMEVPAKSIINQPELQVYVNDFGNRKDDYCLVAEFNRKVIGAVWVRIMNDYGHIDDTTPSLAISLYKEYRGCGIGMDMMRKIILRLKENGYEKVSLSVQKENYAMQI
ncbi:MAG: GNAT family N-acetyltransferase [Clostridium sp.]|uniref:GNAT family N-acetyltransferase n=1 Tax=Clostridium sp. TaxID=1506 RepID=UPI003F39E344